MFSRAVRVGTRLKAWKMKPILSRRSRVSRLSSSVDEVGVADEDAARGEGVEPGDAVHQRRLARARRAHDGGELAGVEVDGDVVEGGHRGVAVAVALGGLLGAGGHGAHSGSGLGGHGCSHDLIVSRTGRSRHRASGRSRVLLEDDPARWRVIPWGYRPGCTSPVS